MIIVYVWWPRTKMRHPIRDLKVGHASMLVDGPDGKAYISWWPSGGDSADRVYCGVKPIIHRSLHEDTVSEGHPPDEAITVSGLNESSILAFWRSSVVRGRYSGVDLNCATTVRHALLLGVNNHHGSWAPDHFRTPEGCAHLARQVKADLARANTRTPSGTKR